MRFFYLDSCCTCFFLTKVFKSPFAMKGKTIKGLPSVSKVNPSSPSTLGWSKVFMIKPSSRNFTTLEESEVSVKRKMSYSFMSHRPI